VQPLPGRSSTAGRHGPSSLAAITRGEEIARVSFADITRAVLPFLIPMVVTLLLITLFPQLVLFLPRLFR